MFSHRSLPPKDYPAVLTSLLGNSHIIYLFIQSLFRFFLFFLAEKVTRAHTLHTPSVPLCVSINTAAATDNIQAVLLECTIEYRRHIHLNIREDSTKEAM